MPSPQAPTISVIVPTHNRPQPLVRCLRALAASELPRDEFEVIVVNDGSTVDYEEALREVREEFSFAYLTQPQSGPGMARNAGIGVARGRFVAFTDDDCVPTPQWLSTLKSFLVANPRAAVGGKTINGLPANPYSETHELLLAYIYEYQARNSPEWSPFFAGNNFALSREECVLTGAFDRAWRIAAAEDRAFFGLWRERGNALVRADEAVIYHFHAMTLFSFMEVHSRYGRGARLLHTMAGQTGEPPVRPGPLSFYWNLILFPFAKFSGLRAVRYSALLALAQAAQVAGYLKQMAAR